MQMSRMMERFGGQRSDATRDDTVMSENTDPEAEKMRFMHVGEATVGVHALRRSSVRWRSRLIIA